MLKPDVDKFITFLTSIPEIYGKNIKSYTYYIDIHTNTITVNFEFVYTITLYTHINNKLLNFYSNGYFKRYSTSTDTVSENLILAKCEIVVGNYHEIEKTVKRVATAITELPVVIHKEELPTADNNPFSIKLNNLISVLYGHIDRIYEDISTVKEFYEQTTLSKNDMEYLNSIYQKYT